MQVNRINPMYQQPQYKNKHTSFKQIMSVNKAATDIVHAKKKFVLILSGPSGVGKDTILETFKNKYPDFLGKIVTCTTRNPRPGEVNGVHYNFLTVSDFNKGVANNKFVEHVEVYPGKSYGTRIIDVKNAIDKAKQNVVMVIDVDGARKAKSSLEKEGLNVVKLFIEPESLDILKDHLIKRGTETQETIAARIARAAYETGCSKEYDVIIQNRNSVEENVRDLEKVFHL